MRVVALIQARYGSTRLPGKATRLLAGLPMLWHVYRRVLKCREVDEVCVAVGDANPEPILNVCEKYGMHWRVGEEKNLLTRIIECATWMKADAVLRVTADCVFHDPELLDLLVREFKSRWPLHRGLSNWPKRYVSEGLDAEVYGIEALLALDREPLCPREDFATYAVQHGYLSQANFPSFSGTDSGTDLHMSVDTEEDFKKAERALEAIGIDDFDYGRLLEEWTA